MPIIDQASGKHWTLYNGDCVEVMRDLPSNSIDASIYSPPFSTLYIYSDSDADMGNCASNEEFFEHYRFMLPELLRVTVTGRLCIVHCKDLPKYANRDGTAGLIDFPGQLIAAHESAGWSYHSRVTIWKCPVIERERTNNNGLLHKTVTRDRSQLRQGMADYVLVFRKAPEGTLLSDKPITRDLGPDGVDDHTRDGFQQYIGTVHPNEQDKHPSRFCRKTSSKDASIDIWRRYAEPVWWDIDQTNVLNCKRRKTDNQERHICPLQLDVIQRALQIWSEPNDVIFSPFAGYGSEGVGAIGLGRRFCGVELNTAYYREAIRFLKSAEEGRKVQALFDLSEEYE
jgi:DNA modification methylase